MAEQNVKLTAKKTTDLKGSDPDKRGLTQVNSERREDARRIVHERCEICLQAVQTDEEGNAKVYSEGCMIDISTKGAGVLSDIRIAPGTKLLIELKSRRFAHRFLVTVLWCGELPSIGKIIKIAKSFTWRVGLRFDVRTREEIEILKAIALHL